MCLSMTCASVNELRLAMEENDINNTVAVLPPEVTITSLGVTSIRDVKTCSKTVFIRA